jgi:hypothetical protein
MRALVQTASDYFKVGGQPVIVTRVSKSDGTVIFEQATATSSAAGVSDRIETFGEISQEIDPVGGFARVSGASVSGLILDSRLPLCS